MASEAAAEAVEEEVELHETEYCVEHFLSNRVTDDQNVFRLHENPLTRVIEGALEIDADRNLSTITQLSDDDRIRWGKRTSASLKPAAASAVDFRENSTR